MAQVDFKVIRDVLPTGIGQTVDFTSAGFGEVKGSVGFVELALAENDTIAEPHNLGSTPDVVLFLSVGSGGGSQHDAVIPE